MTKPKPKRAPAKKPAAARGTSKRGTAAPPQPPTEREKRTVIGDTELARHYNRSERTVQNWRNHGLPHTQHGNTRQYVYDLDQTDEFVAALQSTTVDGETDIHKLNVEIKQLEVRERIVIVEEKEFKQRVRVGDSLDRDVYELHFVETAQHARDTLMRAPLLLCALLPKKLRKVFLKESQRVVRDLLEELEHKLKRGPQD